MDTWVDYEDPLIIEKITGDGSNDEGVADAVSIASEILTLLTGYRVHPEGTATQDHLVSNRIRLIRLTPAYRPVIDLISVETVSDDCVSVSDITNQFCVFAGDIRRTHDDGEVGFIAAMLCNFCGDYHSRLRVKYRFGSTVGAAASRAVIALSRQFWLLDHPEYGECTLPERIINMSREGLSYTFIDPMTFLDAGRTGVPSVDSFIVAVNPSKAKVPAAVYIPEAPPGVPR